MTFPKSSYFNRNGVYISIVATLFLLLPSLCPAVANYLSVEYNSGSAGDQIAVRELDDISYFNINELNKVFNAFITTDVIDNRVYIEIYGHRLIIMLDSSYMQHESKIYNFVFSVKTVDGRFYLPLVFLKEILPRVLKDEVKFDKNNNVLYAEPPIDTSLHTIVIDPGHGGKDPGAVGASKRCYEKDIVLAVAKKVKKIVEDNLDVKVLLTREDDRFVPLQKRTTFANNERANLFISLHCNAAPNKNAKGIEVYFLSAARTDEARAVELLENSVVEKYEGVEALKMYDDLTFILMDMEQAEQLKESSYLAIKLQANLIEKTDAHNRGVKQAGFYVLRGARMPSVLVEFGFISNAQEEKKLNQTAYQQKLAEAVYEGIKSYINNYEMFR